MSRTLTVRELITTTRVVSTYITGRMKPRGARRTRLHKDGSATVTTRKRPLKLSPERVEALYGEMRRRFFR